MPALDSPGATSQMTKTSRAAAQTAATRALFEAFPCTGADLIGGQVQAKCESGQLAETLAQRLEGLPPALVENRMLDPLDHHAVVVLQLVADQRRPATSLDLEDMSDQHVWRGAKPALAGPGYRLRVDHARPTYPPFGKGSHAHDLAVALLCGPLVSEDRDTGAD